MSEAYISDLKESGKMLYGKCSPYQPPLQEQLFVAETTSELNTKMLKGPHVSQRRNLAPGVPQWAWDYANLFEDEHFRRRQILMKNRDRIDQKRLAQYGLSQRDLKEIAIILRETNVQYVMRVYNDKIEEYKRRSVDLLMAKLQGKRYDKRCEWDVRGKLIQLFNEASYICMQVERNDETQAQFTIPLMCLCEEETMDEIFVCQTFYCGWFVCGMCVHTFNEFQVVCVNCGADPGMNGEGFVKNRFAMEDQMKLREDKGSD